MPLGKEKKLELKERFINLRHPDFPKQTIANVATKIYNTLNPPAKPKNKIADMDYYIRHLEGFLEKTRKQYKILQTYGEKFDSNPKANAALTRTIRRLRDVSNNGEYYFRHLRQHCPPPGSRQAKEWFKSLTPKPKRVSDEGLMGIIGDLEALTKEFEQVRYYPWRRELAVKTKPITLEDDAGEWWDLGPMNISLFMLDAVRRRTGQKGYRINPVEPNWAQDNIG
jgi:hypothetical protein